MIPFLDLKRGHEKIKEEIKDAVERVVYKNSSFVLGSEVKSFEGEFSIFCGKKHGIGVNSGTDALEFALRAYGIGNGDEVIIPVNTAIPTAMAVVGSGAKPVFADVGDDYLIDSNKIEEKITKETRAIIPVHLYGQVCDMESIIRGIAVPHGLKVIEDCAQAHGARYHGKRVPIGEVGCFSFYPTKNLGAFGDGGMIVTDDEEISERIKLLRNYGQSDKYHASITGKNSRLDEIQAAVLKTKLKLLDENNNARKKIASRYSRNLEDFVQIPTDNGEGHVYHLYVIRSSDRDGLMDHLSERGIGNLIHYPVPLHMQKAFLGLGYCKGDFPNAERFSKEILSIPIFSEMTTSEVDKVCEIIAKYKMGSKV